jgi:hypothetical protein
MMLTHQQKDWREGDKGYEFVLSQWKWKHFKCHCHMQSIPHHGHKEEGGSLLHLEVGHKCNESTWTLKDGGGPT